MTDKDPKNRINQFQIINPRVEYFLKCAHHSSLGEAAKHIGLTQAALSTSIKKLEEDLGVALFDRNSKGISFTEAGVALHKLFSTHHEAFQQELLLELNQPLLHTLRIGAAAHVGTKFVLPHLGNKKLIPGPIHFFMGLSLQVYEAVKEGRLDCGFIAWTSRPKELMSYKLWSDPMGIVGAKTQYRHIARIKNREALEQETWIHFPKPQYHWDHLFTPARSCFITQDIQSFAKLILEGRGIAEAQLDLFSHTDMKQLVIAPVALRYPDIQIYGIHRKGLPQEKLENFTNLMSVIRR